MKKAFPLFLLAFALPFLLLLEDAYSSYRIIDTHEHMGPFEKAEVLNKVDAGLDIAKTILVASPEETLTLNGKEAFTAYRKNVDTILKIAKTYPERFIPFCTISPLDQDALAYLRNCVGRGGKGLKLYNGHSYFYPVFGMPLDAPAMLPIYGYAEKIRLPLLFHVNIMSYQKELENVLQKYPKLTVSVPHFMVSSLNLPRVERLFAKYPNLYTDISFGSPEFMAAGLRRISRRPQDYVDFIKHYPDRILFGADMVITTIENKDADFMEAVLKCYRDMLEKEHYTCAPVNDWYKKEMEKYKKQYEGCKKKPSGPYCTQRKMKVDDATKWYVETKSLNGLNLGSDILEKIYWENPNRFLTGSP